MQLYFDGMIQRDRGKLEEAFFSEARLIGYRGDRLFVTPFEEWAAGTSMGSPRDPSLYRNEIKAIRLVGNMALVETELYWPGIYYYDFLTLLKMDGKWKIVHKSWDEKPLD
ncbi:MAG: nuclear transport factor 2 family protein [Algoriphagus sp.]|nr:nuclear transport factor 2 family protein [Algoriphagus sp.]